MNSATHIAFYVDMFAMSLVLGATVWFFFIQSPVLFRSMGREKFVPVQVRLAKIFFDTMTIALAIMLGSAVLQTESVSAWPTLTAAFAFVAVCINKLFVLPRALKAGGRSRGAGERHSETGQPVDFASEGAGPSTKMLHRAVVFFVLLMTVGLVGHFLSFPAPLAG